jgi:hypothetical protein
MQVLYDDPELLSKVEEKFKGKSPTPTEENPGEKSATTKVLDVKLQEKLSPLQSQLADIQRQQAAQVVENFSKTHPDAAEGSEVWKQMLEWLPAMKAKGLPIQQGLEKAYEIVTVDKARQSGKVEALRELFTKQQASTAGGSSGGGEAQRASEVELTSDEAKVAASLGIDPKKYANRKAKS